MKAFSSGSGVVSHVSRWIMLAAFVGWSSAFVAAHFTAQTTAIARAADNATDSKTSDDKSSSDKSSDDKSSKDKSADHDKSDEAAPSESIRVPTDPAELAARRKLEDEDYEFYRSLAETIDQVERNYVKPIDRRELMEAAIKGVLSKLDPYSSYISPDEINSFRTTVESQFGGIGIQITPDEGQIKVSTPLVGTPAYKAGVMAGDHIVRIEGESIHGLSLDDVVRRLKGEVGTSVSFTVRHSSGKEEMFNVQREIIHLDTVLGESRQTDDSWNFMLDSDQHIGYIRITAFSRDTAADLKKALETLKQQKMRGLILDLRFNPGGLLTSAIEVCNMFISEGRIVSTKGRNTPERVWDATPASKFEGFPMVILVNGNSASASEIVSACLQDHNRAVIIGERTWGKGSVQNVIDLEDGKSALKLTTATYTRPNGHNIHRFPDSKETDEWGVKPNDGLEVRLSSSETDGLILALRQRDIVPGKIHEEKPKQLAAVAEHASADSHPSEAAAADEPAAKKSEKTSHSEKSDKSSGSEKPEHATKSSSAEEPAGKSGAASSAGTTPGSAAKEKPSSAGSADAKSSAGNAEAKSTPAIHTFKFTDRQLQKALEYLSTEMARAQ
ncbi:MAG TPA: S41 family peptidase [Pirellulales bacterium]|jgi:carboxyl-terminal processing protease|nr:S41 family peptidase [Pirellulales bacterium]